MKRFLLILTMVIGCSLFVSCEPEPTILYVDTPLIDAQSKGASAIINVVSNYEWTASSSADWCVINPTHGDADTKSIQVIIQSNPDYSSRECTITINSKEKQQPISVKQAQRDTLSFENSSFIISCDEQTIDVIVDSSVQYDVSSEVEWIKLMSTKALSSSTYVFQVEANESMSSRKGSIRIKQLNGSKVSVASINQKQKDSIIVSPRDVYFRWDNASASITVKANVDFTINVSEDCDWLHVERSGSGMDFKLRITADNFILTPDTIWDLNVPYRSGTITLTYGNISKTIIVNQQFKDYIWISENEVSLYVNYSTPIRAQAFLHETDKTLHWKSSDENVAIVKEDNIIALSKGQAVITVCSADNSYSATCNVSVKEPIDDVRIAAHGYNVISTSVPSRLTFHSKIYIPSVFQTVEYYSVWLGQPDGTIQEIKSTYDGYVLFSTIYYYALFDQKAADYFSTWYVIYQVALDGVEYEFYQNLNAHTWGSM